MAAGNLKRPRKSSEKNTHLSYQGPTASRSNSTGGSQGMIFVNESCCFFFPGAAWGSGELLIDARQCIPKERLLIFVFPAITGQRKKLPRDSILTSLPMKHQLAFCLLQFSGMKCCNDGRIVNARPEADRHREEVQLRLTKGQPGYFCIS